MSFYSITDIGCLPHYEYSSLGLAINGKAQILGYSWRALDRKSLSSERRAFLWQGEKFCDLGVSSCHGLNDSGVVVGQRIVQSGNDGTPALVAYAYTDRLNDLPISSDAVLSIANAINSDGQIVGKVAAGSPPRIVAYRWGAETGGLRLPEGYNGSEANAINDSGHVSGEVQQITPSGSRLLSRAALWKNSEVMVLKLLPGFEESKATAINNNGVVLGHCIHKENDDGIQQRACLWTEESVQDLGTLSAGKLSIARGINSLGQVVGNAGVWKGDRLHAFLWQDGIMVDLNHLLPDRSGWLLVNASGINDRGQIVGSGVRNGRMHALLLTPPVF